jgi:hypothetical protein
VRKRSVALGPLLLMLAAHGCGAPQPAERFAAVADGSPYQEVVDVAQLMTWILEPAAEVIWDSAGFVITVEGEQDLAPVDDAGWAAVRDATAVVAESGNLLMMPGRARDLGDWADHSRNMIHMARRAMAAADAHDADALFEAGGALYTACVACHQQYWMTDPLALAP